MTEWKIKDIISTMLEEGLLDYNRAKHDINYLVDSIKQYIEIANMVRSDLHMPLI